MEREGGIRCDFQGQKEEHDADNFLPYAACGLDDRGLNATLAIFCHMGRTAILNREYPF
jgi:hypothetical protein